MKNIDSYNHVRGESIYLDDLTVYAETLYAAVFDSPLAHGKIIQLDITEALKITGVIDIITAKRIPGKNQIGGIVADEKLLAEDFVYFIGMPIAIVVAKSIEIAHKAIKNIKIDIEPLPIITNPREAKELGELIVPPRTFELGNTENGFEECDYIFEGIAETNGQEHLYIETQGAYAIPQENNSIKIYSSTQGPTAVQKHVADVLGIPMHKIEVDVTRLGGGFGGKEDQATVWAAICALAAFIIKKPIKYSLHRMEDMRMTGKRNPYSSDFKIGLNKELKIIAYEATFYQNAGATADLSPAVLERTLFHSTNSYFIPNVKATAYSCKTNLPSNTAFRGFGGPQGMFVIESAIAFAANKMGIDAYEIQKKNLIKSGDEFPFGQKAESEANECWLTAESIYNFESIKKDISEYNKSNIVSKKGFSLMPICFGISFTKTFMNQARALVHIYNDGSISISTGAVEMGQGVNTKIVQVAAEIFSIDSKKITIHSTNTFRIANTSPSAASATADLNGKAVLMACKELYKRLLKLASLELNVNEDQVTLKNELVCLNNQPTNLSWNQLVQKGHFKQIGLSEHAHYVTPTLHYNSEIEKGHPFAYHVYGTAITIVTIDCIRGTYSFDAVKIVHDVGKSMNKNIDVGQIEGGLIQGMGWMTMEEIIYDLHGKLKSNTLSTYKVPDIYSVPKNVEIHFFESDKDNLAIFNSKAVGEPPLMYGIGAYFAICNAIKAFNVNAEISYAAPFTPEKVLMALYSNK
jgi:xanthine dehydrogenase large subunit